MKKSALYFSLILMKNILHFITNQGKQEIFTYRKLYLLDNEKQQF